MCVRKLSAILLFISLWTVSTYGQDKSNGNFVVGLTSEDDNNSENVFYQAENCVSDADCHHLGECETRDDGKFCNCKNGTSGDFCEIVDDCTAELCGTSDDVSCIFDIELETAICKCDNETKTYVPREERCMSPCTRRGQCGRYGNCFHKIGSQKFCSCGLGMIGDYCEIVEKCHTKEVDCGADNNATCEFADEGEAYCECDDPTLGFDYDEKVCKDCSGCGEKIYRPGECEYKEGRRICYCKLPYYSSDEGKCEDCKCGANGYGCSFANGTKICKCSGDSSQNGDVCEKCKCGANGYGCSFVNETKICKCFGGNLQKGDICEDCYCGPGESKCEFVLNKKVCTCKEGYTTEKEESNCRELCNATVPCQNGGKCVQNLCECLNGTSGDLCEIVDYCAGSMCGSSGTSECVYNVTSQEGYCKCIDPKQAFDDYYDYCRDCDCGEEMRSCSYKMGRKNCSCNIRYAAKNGECALCDCGSHSNRYGCYFDYFKKVCQCDKGYIQVYDQCRECDCGENGICSLQNWGTKSCTCNEGYTEQRGICKKCDCGRNGYCRFDFEGKKRCTCNSGYQEYKGTCTKCQCGDYADCKIIDIDTIVCTCRSGYVMEYGKCTACNCYPGKECTSDQYFNKKCICPKGYADDRGTCKVCDCRVKGSNCSLASVVNTCECPQGYEQVRDPSSYLKTYCDDINECIQQYYYTCPLTTNCVNTIGSYDCICEEGYEEYDDDRYDIKTDGCRDIDECAQSWSACYSQYSRCVNTPGSYRCECRDGYILYESYDKKLNRCLEGTRPWRTATIVVGVVSGVTIATLILIVIGRRYR